MCVCLSRDACKCIGLSDCDEEEGQTELIGSPLRIGILKAHSSPYNLSTIFLVPTFRNNCATTALGNKEVDS